MARHDHVRLLWQRLLIALLVVLSIFSTVAVWKVFWKEHESSALRKEAESRLSDLEVRHGKLAADIASLKTDFGKEKILRGEYDVGKEGERLIVIVEPPAAPPQATSTPWYERLKWW